MEFDEDAALPERKRQRLSTAQGKEALLVDGFHEPGTPEQPRQQQDEAAKDASRESAPAPQYRLKATLLGHTKGLSSVKVSPSEEWVVTAGADGRLLLYSLSDFTFWRAMEHNTLGYGGINDVAWSPDSQYIASASDDKTVKVFEAHTGHVTRLFHGHTAYVFCLAYNPQGSLLVSGSFDETLKLWDVGSGKCLKTIQAHSDPISSVDVNRDGSMIATSSRDGLVRIWDCMTGQCIKSLSDESNHPVSNVHFAPNGKFVLACSLDSIIRLWCPFTERAVKTYTGHVNVKYDITSTFVTPSSGSASSPSCVASGSEDGRIFVWDVQSRKVVCSWQAHIDVVIGVAATSSGRYLISAGLEKDLVAKVWVDISK